MIGLSPTVDFKPAVTTPGDIRVHPRQRSCVISEIRRPFF